MSAPYEIRNQAQSDLWKALQIMMSPNWDKELIGKPVETVREAAIRFLEVQRARLRLGNAELSDIRDKLVQNEVALKQGGKAMKKSFDDLKQVEQILATTAAFLTVIGTVVSLAT